MNHATLELVVLERTACRAMGHRGLLQDTPVAEFWVCLRCGKFWRDDR